MPSHTSWIILLPSILAGAAAAQSPQPADDARYFQPAVGWSLGAGTDVALTWSDEKQPSTSQTNSGASHFDTLWLRANVHLDHGRWFSAVVDVFADDERRPVLFGAYVRVQPVDVFGLRVGLIPLTVGAWQDRALPSRQPLINQPLPSQYLTSLRNDSLPGSLDELLAQRGRGRDARYALAPGKRSNGVTLAYEHCWDTGIEAFGRLGRLRYRLAAAEGTPGAPAARVRGRKNGASLQGRLTWQTSDALRLGASYARGPYLLDDVARFLPAGRRLGDYRQELAGVDLRVKGGALEAHGEWLWNRYASPLVAPSLRTQGYTGELSWELRPGLRAAVRLSGLRHRRVTDARGRAETWDADARRLETGLAYRFAADHLAVKAVFQRTRVALTPPRVEDVFALQLAFGR